MKIKGKSGFTLIEAIVVMGIFSLIMGAASLVLLSGRSVWATLDIEIQLQESLRNAMEKISKEVKQSGSDGTGVMQLVIYDGTGVNGSDIIRFSVPLCVCSNIVINNNRDVAYWGAPLTWGSLSCITDSSAIIPDSDGKVDICHVDSDDPTDTTDMNVLLAEVGTHLAHGDWVGECSPCTTAGNKFIEYRLNAEDQLIRRVLSSAAVTVKDDVIASNVTNLQAGLNVDQDVIIIAVTVSRNTVLKRTMTKTAMIDIILENI